MPHQSQPLASVKDSGCIGEVAPGDNRVGCLPRILMVDDNEVICRLNRRTLGSHGYSVDTANDGEAGWNAIVTSLNDSTSYDLVVTDNNMPQLSGVELIEKMRSAQIRLPVIMASGSIPADVRSLRIAAVLPKPYFSDQLVQTVKKVLLASRG